MMGAVRPTSGWSVVLRSLLISMTAASILPSVHAQQTPPGAPTFRRHATAVNVNVTVRRGNNPVTGLMASAFSVTDNGVPQQVEFVSYEVMPIDVTLVVDISGSTTSIAGRIRHDAERILGFLRPIDRVRVLTIYDGVHEILPLQSVSPQMRFTSEATVRTLSPVRDAILAALIVAPDPDRRRLVVVITDGEDTRSVAEAAQMYEVGKTRGRRASSRVDGAAPG
jgi:hypothetical protein